MGQYEHKTLVDTPRAQNRARLRTAILDIISAEETTVVDEAPTISAEDSISDLENVFSDFDEPKHTTRVPVPLSSQPFPLYGPAPRTPRRRFGLPILVVTGLLILLLLSWAYL